MEWTKSNKRALCFGGLFAILLATAIALFLNEWILGVGFGVLYFVLIDLLVVLRGCQVGICQVSPASRIAGILFIMLLSVTLAVFAFEAAIDDLSFGGHLYTEDSQITAGKISLFVSAMFMAVLYLTFFVVPRSGYFDVALGDVFSIDGREYVARYDFIYHEREFDPEDWSVVEKHAASFLDRVVREAGVTLQEAQSRFYFHGKVEYKRGDLCIYKGELYYAPEDFRSHNVFHCEDWRLVRLYDTFEDVEKHNVDAVEEILVYYCAGEFWRFQDYGCLPVRIDLAQVMHSAPVDLD